MDEFEKIVSAELGRLPHDERDEIVRELSGHLQERFDELRSAGTSEDEARRTTLAEVGDWQQLRKGILRAKEGIMTARAKTILIPGIVALLMTGLGEQLLMNAGVRPKVYWQYISWMTSTWQLLAIFVVAGAIGAGWSRAAGGSRSQRLWAAQLPVVCMLIVFVFLFSVGPAIELTVKHTLQWATMWHTLLGLLFWDMLLPGFALLMGALPFVIAKQTMPAERDARSISVLP